MRRLLLLVMLSSVILAACTVEPPLTTQLTSAAATILPTALAASETPAPSATLTETPVPTATTLPSPTPTPPHPMDIRVMRQVAYPGSPMTIERELEPGANYSRYYASYLSEGLKIYALLTVPYGEPPEGGFPAIVFNHGHIPPDIYRTTERYIAYVDRLATAGYIVFRIDYRGHDQSEGEPNGAYSNPGYTTDVLNAVAALQQFPSANPDKIGMWGHSMGGYLTLRAMVISNQIKAGVIWAGVVGSYPDMQNNWRRGPRSGFTPRPGSRSWRQEWVQRYGSIEQNPEFWAAVSSNTYVNELSGPIQLHHGTADEDVPLIFSEHLNQQIMEAGGAVELYTYDGDDHNLSGYFSLAMDRTVEFFDRYLKQ